MAASRWVLSCLFYNPAHIWSSKRSKYTLRKIRKALQDILVFRFDHRCRANWESQEAVSQEIALLDDNPIIVEKMMGYLYKLDYSDSPQDCAGHPALLINAQVYTIAEKYNIHSLKKLALKKFDGMAVNCWEDDGFSSAIKEIYTSTPETDKGLRNIVCDRAKINMKVLLRRPDFRATLLEVTEFTVDMLDAVVKAM